MQKAFMQIGNALKKAVLCSPLHWAISNNILLIGIIGRKSGCEYTVPVNYVRVAKFSTLLVHAAVSGGATCEVACRSEFAYKGEIWKGKEWLWKNVPGH